jgi:copper chaperone CopZ
VAKKVVKLEGLCCANCASKIEVAVQKLDGVTQATLSFMTQRLVIEASDEAVDRVLEKAREITAKIEPEAEFRVVR